MIDFASLKILRVFAKTARRNELENAVKVNYA